MLPAAGWLLAGTALLLPAALLIDRPWTLSPSAASLEALLALAIYFRLVQALGSIGATAQCCLRVPIGVAIGVLALGERMSLTASLGLGCVVAGVIRHDLAGAEGRGRCGLVLN